MGSAERRETYRTMLCGCRIGVHIEAQNMLTGAAEREGAVCSLGWPKSLNDRDELFSANLARLQGTETYSLDDENTNPKKAFGDAKVPLHLVPPALGIGAARAFNEGRKYGPFNWRTKAVDAMTYIGAIMRHLDAYRDGEDVDPDSKVGKLHLEGIAACVAILLDMTYAGTLIDNRPPKGAAPEELRKLVPHVEGPKEGK